MAVGPLEQLVGKRVNALWNRAPVLIDHQDDLPAAVTARDRGELIAGELTGVDPAATRERRYADAEAVSRTGDDDLASAFRDDRLHCTHLTRLEQTPREERSVEVGDVAGGGDDRA